jgi:CRISPR-associated endoribonuclease Cas6
MLAAIDVRIYPTEDVELPHPSAHLIHAAVLNMFRTVDPDTSAFLHDTDQVEPLSVSTLWPRTRAQGDRLIIRRYTECRFRVCCLTRNVFDAVSAPILTAFALKNSITIQGRDFVVIEAGMEPPYGGAQTFADIYRDIGPSAILRFVSPTTFRRDGLNIPLPDPGLVYGSLWQKWQHFSDVRVEQEVFDEMMTALALSGAEIRTWVWKFPRFKMLGFAGVTRFELVHNVSPEARKLFGGLSSLAFYSGVGYQTAMGMGQCVMLVGEQPDEEYSYAENGQGEIKCLQ